MAWDGIWRRPLFVESWRAVFACSYLSYNFSAEMLEAMTVELNQFILKYGSSYWNLRATANRLVELLMEHRVLIQLQLNDVNAGTR